MKQWLIPGFLALASLALYVGLKSAEKFSDAEPLPLVSRYLHDCTPALGPCSVEVGLTPLTLQLFPPGLPAMERLTLRVDAPSLSGVQVLRTWFEGRDMDMGRHDLIPAPESSSSAAQVFSGVIPVCTINPTMVWQLKLLFQVQNEQHLIVFDLVSQASNDLRPRTF